MGPADLHVVTMTGELADTFASRREGVERLAALARARAGRHGHHGLCGPGRLHSRPTRARQHVDDIASANWHASAALVARAHAARRCSSTWARPRPISCRSPTAQSRARGYTDAERLAAGELVYTGLVRSFVMAVADRVPFAGAWTPLVNENFATMADVHRILGNLPDGADQMATADGREKTVAASRARLARMVGRDAADADAAAWTALAQWFAEAQLRAIIDGAMLVASAGPLPPDAPIVGAGIGSGLVREVARRLGRSYVPFEELLKVEPRARECGVALRTGRSPRAAGVIGRRRRPGARITRRASVGLIRTTDR